MGSFSSWLAFSTLALSIFIIGQASADCQSYGVDYVDGGSYFINTESPDYFSFVTKFEGCTEPESNNPLLIDPNGDEYFCSDIETLPNGELKESTCNVAGNELLKADMFSGTWIIINQGLTFAWMREFELTAGVQSRTTVTPTSEVVFNFTTQSTMTETTTSFQTINSTLPANTVVLPSKTDTVTQTVTPPKHTVTSTISLIQTIEIPKFTVTDVTTTVPAACALLRWRPQPDRRLTYLPTKTDLSAKVTGSPRELPNGDLAERAIDPPIITITASPVIETLTSTITAPPTTVTMSKIYTTTSVITPPPVTMLSGIAHATVTAPTPTRTSFTITAGITTIDKTITATITKYVTTTPNACFPFGIPFLGEMLPPDI